ncbi:MAG: transposase [Bacilli bacterium]|nr:transposase [Bacilli bacterium]
MSNFVVEFPLKTEKYQEDILDKRFEIGRQMYNSLVTVTQKRYKEMITSRVYKDLMKSLSGDKRKDKEVWKQVSDLRSKYGLTEYSFQKDIKEMQHHYKKNIDSHTAQKIASRLWKSYEKLFFGNGKKVYYKKYGELNSLEGKRNSTGIRYINEHIEWNGLKIPIVIDRKSYYEYEALQSEIAFCKIIRRYVRTRNKYYVQIVFKGIPPLKVDIETGEIKHYIGKGNVGIDIGTSTIAVASENDLKIYELADRVENIEKAKRILLRKMDRSLRSMNPDNYNEDGTSKKGVNKWIKSNHYKRYQEELKELYRKQAAIRKYQHECMANYVVSMGNKVYVEKMNFAGLQRRAKETTKTKDGKYKSKKRYGKSIGNRAPSMLLTMINRKLGYFNERLIEINTYKVKASQYSHEDDTYVKKSRSNRFTKVGNRLIQRDLYSAYLIQNVNEDLESINKEKCKDRYSKFLEMYEKEVERLSKRKNISCVGI